MFHSTMVVVSETSVSRQLTAVVITTKFNQEKVLKEHIQAAGFVQTLESPGI